MSKISKLLFCVVALSLLLAVNVSVVRAVGGGQFESEAWRDGSTRVYPLVYPAAERYVTMQDNRGNSYLTVQYVDYASPLYCQFAFYNTSLNPVSVEVDGNVTVVDYDAVYSFMFELDAGLHYFAVYTAHVVLYTAVFKIIEELPQAGQPQITYTLRDMLDLRTSTAQLSLVTAVLSGVAGAFGKKQTKITVYPLLMAASVPLYVGLNDFVALFPLAIAGVVFSVVYFLAGESCEWVILSQVEETQIKNKFYPFYNGLILNSWNPFGKKKLEVKDGKAIKFNVPDRPLASLYFVKDIETEGKRLLCKGDKAFSQALVDAKIVEKLDSRLKDAELELGVVKRATKSYAMQIWRQVEEILATHKIDEAKGFSELDKTLEEIRRKLKLDQEDKKDKDDQGRVKKESEQR